MGIHNADNGPAYDLNRSQSWIPEGAYLPAVPHPLNVPLLPTSGATSHLWTSSPTSHQCDGLVAVMYNSVFIDVQQSVNSSLLFLARCR